MINILIAVGGLGVGGTERAAQVFAQYLTKEKGVKVIVGSGDTSGERAKKLEEDGIEIINLKEFSVDDIVSKYKIDVVFNHFYDTKDFAKFKDIIRIQEVVFAHSYDKKININIAISNALSYKIKLINPNANIITLYYPQDTEIWAKYDFNKKSLINKYKIPKNTFIVGRIARPEPSKRDYLFIPSVKKLIDRNNDIYLLLVGCPLIFKFFLWNYRNHITYVQPTADDQILGEIYSLTDVFFHTAERGETFGNVNAEAMFFGKPVVTHSTHFKDKNGKILMLKDNAQIEIVEHGINGFVGNTPEQIVTYIEKLKNNKTLYSEISKNNKEKIENTLDAKVIVKKLLEIIYSYKDGNIKFEDQKDLERKYNDLFKFEDKKDKIYNFKYKVYKKIEFLYLIKRKILRKFNIDLEKFKIFD